MRSVARWCVVHRRVVLAGWLVALIGLTVHQPERRQRLQGQLQLEGHAELRGADAA